MLKKTLAAIAIASLLASPAAAGVKGFGFSLDRKTTAVKGVLVVDGYTMAEMKSLMRKYSKGGKIGDFTFTGKPRKKRGIVYQKFTTTCAGGPHDRFKGGRSSYEIEYITTGEYKNKHLAEITYSDGSGNIKYAREITKP